MNWYVVQTKIDQINQIIDSFNCFDDIVAFTPKTERWYNIKGKKDYVIKDLYPGYIFIQTELSYQNLKNRYQSIFEVIFNKSILLNDSNINVVSTDEQIFLEKIFNGEEIVKHSVGNIIDSVLIVDEGPLVGMEDKVIKIDRHKRLATLKIDLINSGMKVPLEVVSKS
ncbi:MAG: transcription termination/antitermination NusG family protein [Thomasclavelia sp.]